MDKHKFTDEEVIKALECCIKSDSVSACMSGCPLYEANYCPCIDDANALTTYALDLINRQKAEIAALTSAVDNSTKEFLKLHDTYQDQKAEIERFADIGKMYSEIKAEAIKEFAERLKSELEAMQRVSDGKVVFSVSVERIESVVKERLEGG